MPNPNEQIDTPVTSPTEPVSVQQTYGSSYYADYCGMPYDRSNEHWLRFFGGVADHIVRDIAPATAFDVGCAKGLLVEALLDRGVDARGSDISEYAIGEVREDLRGRCRVGSALDPLDRQYDLVTCIEVIEHLAGGDAEGVVANICEHTSDVIFSSTPSGYEEETHININPPEHWAELFARFGFHRDLTYDLTYLAPWAMRFRRARDPMPRMVREYEREIWRLRDEAQQRNQLVISQLAKIDALRTAESTRLRVEKENVRLQTEADRLSSELGTLQRQLLEAAAELRNLQESGAARFARVVQQSAIRVAPPGTRRQRAVRAGVILATEGPSGLRKAAIRRRDRHHAMDMPDLQEQYDEWRRRHEPSWGDLNRMRRENRTWTHRPLVSIIMPTYDPEPGWLGPAIDSVLGQVYENWELCIADDASTAPHVGDLLTAYAATDARIKVVMRSENGGIAAASATALESATGEYIGLLDHDDLLRPHALHAVVERLQSQPQADVIYSDEDMLLTGGIFGHPHFKPDWSPDFLLSINYICHFLVIKRALVERAGGFRSGFDGAQDHDLLLRVTEQAEQVEHIADVLYAWRQVPGSVALAGDAKLYAYEAGVRAVADALSRRSLSGRVRRGQDLGRYHVRLDILDNAHVAILIPTRDRVDLLEECIESIERLSTYSNWSITIIDNDSADPRTLSYLQDTSHRVVRRPGHFNYSRLINFGRSQVDAPYILTLNNDVTVISPDWIEALLEQGQRPEVGVVGGRLLFPDGRPQHEGVAIGNVRGGHLAANLDAGWMGRVIRNVSAVTGACQLIRADVFDEVGGYDEELQVGFNDIDFCLRVQRAGYRVIYTPHAELSHRESATRGKMDPAADYGLFWTRWGLEGRLRDPYLSPHLRSVNPLHLRLGPLPSDR